MPNLLRFPVVLISMVILAIWSVSHRNHRTSTSIEQQRDQLVLRVEQASSTQDLNKRRATLRANHRKGPPKKVEPSKPPSNATTQARIVGLSPAFASPPSTLDNQPVDKASFDTWPDTNPNQFAHQSSSSVTTPATRNDFQLKYRNHRITDGDDLHRLANRYLGDESRYLEIYAINEDRLSNPELLPIGTELMIPPR
ncbi:MAG: hypothetical protein GY768_21670 [Planctomycetaceae bacterium]|nr:hypothetical protein [Planctomycetaceae bacterium]